MAIEAQVGGGAGGSEVMASVLHGIKDLQIVYSPPVIVNKTTANTSRKIGNLVLQKPQKSRSQFKLLDCVVRICITSITTAMETSSSENLLLWAMSRVGQSLRWDRR